MLLAQRLEQPNAAVTIQPILSKVMDHQKWVQALLTDGITTMATDAILVCRDLAISNLGGQFPKDVLRSLRTSQLLGDLMFHISMEDLEDLKKRRNERFMFSVLRQAAQPKPQVQEFKAPKTPKLSSFCGSSSSSSGAKPKTRAAKAPSSQQPQASAQSTKQSTQQSQADHKGKSKQRGAYHPKRK